MSPTLNSAEVKSPRLPVVSRTVTARPTQRVPGTIWPRPCMTPSKATSSSALAMVGVASVAKAFRMSSDTVMGGLLHERASRY